MASSSSAFGNNLNLKHILYDYALPGVVAIGVGLFTYALTGGELEYPAATPAAPNSQSVGQAGEDGFHLDGQQDNSSNQFPLIDHNQQEDLLENVMTQIEQQLALYADKTSEQVVTRWKAHSESCEPPVWAKELLQKAISIEQEIFAIKQQLQLGGIPALPGDNKNNNNNADSNSSGSNKETVVPNIPSAEDYRSKLRLAIFCFAMEVADADLSYPALHKELLDTAIQSTSNASEDDVLRKKCIAACDMMLLFLKNLATQPEVPRYRRIATTNAGYKSTLATAVGISRLFTALGFTLKGAYWEWSWYPDETASSVSSSSSSAKEPIPSKDDAIAIVKHGMELMTNFKKGKLELLQTLASTLTPATELADSTISLSKPELNTSDSHAGIVGILKREEGASQQHEVSIETKLIPSTPPRKVEDQSAVSEKPISPMKQSRAVPQADIPSINKINTDGEQFNTSLKNNVTTSVTSSAPATPSKNKSLIVQFENLSRNNRNSETPLRGGRIDPVTTPNASNGNTGSETPTRKEIIARFESLSRTPSRSQMESSITSPNRLRFDEKLKNAQASSSSSANTNTGTDTSSVENTVERSGTAPYEKS